MFGYDGTRWLPQGGSWVSGVVESSGISDFTAAKPWSVGATIFPSISVQVNQAALLENNDLQTFIFTFESSFSVPEALTVHFSVSGTATFNDDYYLVSGADSFTTTAGTITIPAGQSSADLAIQVQQDAVYEEDETIIITILQP